MGFSLIRRDRIADRSPRLLLTGGGTGGHIYPALSIAHAVRERYPDAEVLYVGTREGLEADLVPRAGLPFTAVNAYGLVGKGIAVATWRAPHILRGLGQALGVVRRFRPDVVVGTGGYVSGPVIAAAALLRVPVALQEQNAVPGVTNRFLSRFAGFIAVAYEESRRFFPAGAPVTVTGNPVRPEVARMDRGEARRALGLGPEDALVLIFMGSRGSATVNRAVAESLSALAGYKRIRVLFGTGEAHFDEVISWAGAAGLVLKEEATGSDVRSAAADNIEVRSYIHDIIPVLAAADLAVVRAGAVTLAEISVRGLPAVLIPSPHVTHRHQNSNAAVMERHGAARVIPESGLGIPVLAGIIGALVADRDILARMSENSRRLGRPSALEEIVTGILNLTGRAW